MIVAFLFLDRAVICDFGCSYESPESLNRANTRVLRVTAGGNPAHYSPELCTLSRDPNVVCDVSKADVWAVGLLAYEMVTGRDAADILSYHQKQVRQQPWPRDFLTCEIMLSLVLIQTHYTVDVLPQLHGMYSAHCQRLLQQLVLHSVENRPSASQAIQLCCIVRYGPTIPSVGDDLYGFEKPVVVIVCV